MGHLPPIGLDRPEGTLPRMKFQLVIDMPGLPRLHRALRNAYLSSASEGQLRDVRSRNITNVAVEVEKGMGKVGESGVEGRNRPVETATPSGANEMDAITTTDATDPL